MNGPIIAYRGNIGVQTSAPFANTKSLSLDGVDDYVTCGNMSGLDAVQTFTISTWIKADNFTGIQRLIGKRYSASYHIALNFSADEIYPTINGDYGYTTNANLVGGTWYHLAMVFDGTLTGNTNRLKLYIDGVQKTMLFAGTIPSVTYNFALNPSTFYLGTDGFATPNYYGGLIDEVGIFNTAEPIANLWDGSGKATDLSSLNPISWYRNGDNGSWKSPQWLIPNNENKDKVSNYTLDFDGVDDSLNIGNIPAISNTTEFSLSCWFKTDDVNTQTTLWCQGSSASQLWAVSKYLNGFIIYGGTSTKYKRFTPFISINTWYNLVVVYNGSLVNADRFKVYLNGVLLVGSDTGTIETTTPTFTTDAIIGRISYGNASYFKGNIDETAFFNTALNQSDVDDIYNGGNPTTISGATNYYKMGEEATFSSNWTVPDSVGSNNGTSANMTIEDRIGDAPNSTSNAVSLNMDEVDRTTDVPS